MATNNALNNQTASLTIDPGASGDSFTQFDINGTNEFIIGVDDTDGNSFKLSQGGALGTNDHFTMSTDGERLMPLNPCFLANLGSDENNVTGSGAVHTIGSSVALTSIFDQGGDLSSLSPVTFTAPRSGRYLLSLNCSYRGASITATDIHAIIVTSNRTHEMVNSFTPSSVGFFGINQCLVVDMDALDTATYNALIDGQVLNTADMDGHPSGGYTSVSGVLIS